MADGDWVESKDQDPDGDVRLIQLADVGDGEYLNKSNRFLTSRKAAQLKCTFLNPGDVLVSRMADPIGRACIFPGDPKSCVAVVDICVIRPDPGIANPEWVKYAINSQRFRSIVESRAVGATRPRISGKNLRTILINLPPLTEQRRIVDILSRAEGIVRLRKEAEKKAAGLMQGIFLEMFGDPATNPKGYEISRLPDVLAHPFKNGLYLPKEKYSPDGSSDGVEMVHMSDAFYGKVKRGKLRRVRATEKQINEYGLSKDDLLVARRSLNFDGAAKVCGIPNSDEPLLFESSFIRLTPDSRKVRAEYLLSYLNNERTRKAHIFSRISGITISGINQASLSQIPVMTPNLHEQGIFMDCLNDVLSIQSQQSTATAKAQATFDALLGNVFANSS